MTTLDLTTEMLQAGYQKLKQMADDHGYGWSFNMVAEDTAEAAMGEVFKAMVEAAPAGWGGDAAPVVATVRRGFVQPGHVGEPFPPVPTPDMNNQGPREILTEIPDDPNQ